jgi:hypothetical protein
MKQVLATDIGCARSYRFASLNEVVLAYYRFGGTMIVITILLP